MDKLLNWEPVEELIIGVALWLLALCFVPGPLLFVLHTTPLSQQ